MSKDIELPFLSSACIQVLYRALVDIRETVRTGRSQIRPDLHSTTHSRYGLCDAIQVRCNEPEFFERGGVADFRTALFKAWPEFSGDVRYPVSSPNCNEPASRRFRWENKYGHMWYGSYGEARKRLLNFMISTIEKEFSYVQD